MSHSEISRRNVLRARAVAAAAAAGSGLAAAPAAAHGGSPSTGGPERLALVNGRIHTLDRRNRVVSSVLIEDGRFVAVGTGCRPMVLASG